MRLSNKILLAGIAFVIVISASLSAYINKELNRSIAISGSTYFEVKKGATIGSIAHYLNELDLLPISTRLFRYYGVVTSGAGSIKAGEYELVPGMNVKDLLLLVRSGKVRQRQITFLEGWTFRQWRDYLRGKSDINQTLEPETDRGVMKLLGKPRLHPEGQFFPDTYHYIKGENDIEILRRAHKKLESVMEQQWQSRTIGDVLQNPYEALILASIVEKETGYSPDRSRVARVFLNRLGKNIRLQSDPTVIYGLGDNFDGNLRRAHLNEPHPYNTYVNEALPPTPICMPGMAAIQATLRAEPGAFLFFVARGDGSSYFSLNLDEHNRAVNRYQKLPLQKEGPTDGYRSSRP
ncbi:MAG: endolytic transglycosylase MltG [Gammaproteobacteria bacterium]|nr:endolytic transglycosylase MltG [Gammaproteobacteria bacterium]